MGYTAMMFLNSVMLAPIILIVTGFLWWAGRRLRILPPGRSALPAFPLIACLGYAGLYLFATADMLYGYPAEVQRQFLDKSYGTPLTLRSMEVIPGLADPGTTWRYRLGAEDARLLSSHCMHPTFDGAPPCLLFDHDDGRVFSRGSLEGNELLIMDLFH